MLNKLRALVETMNFETTASKVFRRLILGENPGLLVLWGGLPGGEKTNKSYFLDIVEAFAEGVTPAAANILPGDLKKLLAQVTAGHYQCVRVIEDCHVPKPKVYKMTLASAVPLAIAGAAQRRGLTSGRNVVILCDDLQKFMVYQRQSNEEFLRDLSQSLDTQNAVTFLGASQLTWDAKHALGPERSLPLGWD